MPASMSPTARSAGFWSAVAATAFGLTYVFGQLAEWLGWLGSRGGPESLSTPFGIVVLLTPSLFLAPAFLLMTICLHDRAPAGRRVWSHAAVACATAYTVMVGINYYVQLTWVGPRLAAGRLQGMESFVFVPFDSFLYAVDILGYSFMSLATLCAGLSLAGDASERIARWFLIANGLILPFIALQMYWHWFIWIASAWALTFPGATTSVAILFRRTSTTV